MGGVGLATAGFGLASTAPATSAQALSVVPQHGSYSGVDHRGRIVTFSFSGTQVSHFQVNHLVIGGAHASQGRWHETCHNGVCTKGAWITDSHVSGFWRHASDSSWTAWDARTSPPVTPYPGTYMGNDHSGLRVHLSFHNGHVKNFNVDHNAVGDAAVSDGKFEVCHQSICFKGDWENDYTVVGSWRYSNSHHWRPWEAYAYAN